MDAKDSRSRVPRDGPRPRLWKHRRFRTAFEAR